MIRDEEVEIIFEEMKTVAEVSCKIVPDVIFHCFKYYKACPLVSSYFFTLISAYLNVFTLHYYKTQHNKTNKYVYLLVIKLT